MAHALLRAASTLMWTLGGGSAIPKWDTRYVCPHKWGRGTQECARHIAQDDLMRVIAGEFRSRRLQTLSGLALRPTPDRLRETLFNILAPKLRNAVFLDAYAGSGAVGIEALSRGAARAIFIEKHRPAVDTIRENLKTLGLLDRSLVVAGPAAREIAAHPADLVFVDPPYPLEKEYAAVLESLGRNPPALAIVQHSIRFELAERYGNLARTRVVRQGDNALSFFSSEQAQLDGSANSAS
ncbi:MAG: 16S rRNA (guanine(966)-N(2))-methyltransferase RsmD [Bryobacteraceae bacterium]